MSPADGLILPPEKTIGLGVPRFVWLNALKISVRNCMFTFSDIGKLFTSERSTLERPGPRNTPRPKLPQVPTVGRTNAFGSNHCVCIPSTIGPEKDRFTDGRSGFRRFPSADWFEPICGVNGKPLSSVVIPLNCHPPATRDQP